MKHYTQSADECELASGPSITKLFLGELFE